MPVLYGTIYFNEDTNIAQKCTGCAHLLDSGWTEPRCVDACPTLALKFMDEDEAKDLIAEAEVLKPELKDSTKPRVYYKDLPGKFIAGTVYDPEEEEVLIGAQCTLKDNGSGSEVSIETDAYGDFWFEGLTDGQFDLKIESGGKSKTFSALDTNEADINLGDIAFP